VSNEELTHTAANEKLRVFFIYVTVSGSERSDRARSNRDAINERRFRSIGLIRLNKRTAVAMIRLI